MKWIEKCSRPRFDPGQVHQKIYCDMNANGERQPRKGGIAGSNPVHIRNDDSKQYISYWA